MSFRLEARDLEGRWELSKEAVTQIKAALSDRIPSSGWSTCLPEMIQQYVSDLGRIWFHRAQQSDSLSSRPQKLPKWATLRLRVVADMHPPHTVNIDLGTDHAYLPILLTQTKKSPVAFGVDIAEHPLVNAEKIVKNADLVGRISLVRGDGILPFVDGTLKQHTLLPLSTDNYSLWEEKQSTKQVTVTICGIGGSLAADMISKLPNWVSTVIVQANDHPEAVDRVFRESEPRWSLHHRAMTIERNRLFITKLVQREHKDSNVDTDHDHLWRWFVLSRSVRKLSLTPNNHESYARKLQEFDQAVNEFFVKTR